MTWKDLITDDGFISAFWELLARSRRHGHPMSHREAFDELNDLYEENLGVPRYPSFDAFRVKRDRKFKKSSKK